MNSNQILEMALGLEQPWHIKKIDMAMSESGIQDQIDIYLDIEIGFKFPDIVKLLRGLGSILIFFSKCGFCMPLFLFSDWKRWCGDGESSLGSSWYRIHISF